MELANKCLEKNTHLKSTLRKEEKAHPKLIRKSKKGSASQKKEVASLLEYGRIKGLLHFCQRKMMEKLFPQIRKIEKGKR